MTKVQLGVLCSNKALDSFATAGNQVRGPQCEECTEKKKVLMERGGEKESE